MKITNVTDHATRLYLLLVHRAMLSTVQTIQYLMTEVSLNNDLEAELVSLHHLAPSRVRPDNSPVQLHHLSCGRPSPEHATPLYHSVNIIVVQAVCATSLSSGTWRLSDHSAMCYTDSVSPLPSSLFMLRWCQHSRLHSTDGRITGE